MNSPPRVLMNQILPPQIQRARVTPIWNRYPELLPVSMESNSNDLIGPLFPNANYNAENANAIFPNNPFIGNAVYQPRFEVKYRVLPSVKVHADTIEVFDLLMADSSVVNVKQLDEDLIYFKSKNSYFSLPLETIANNLETNENIFFKCNTLLTKYYIIT